MLGAAGAALLLLAFALLELKLFVRERWHFHIINFFGAALLTIYAVLIQSTVFLVLNAAWAAVAVYEIIKIART